MSTLEKAIAAVSPRWAASRARNRFILNRFEAASRTKRTSGWKTTNASINADMRLALATLRSRSRDLAQNNAYAASAHREIPANVVGSGIIPTFGDGRAEELAKQWFDTPMCDADGRHDFYGLQALIMREAVESGECLVRKRVRPLSPELPIPLQLQVLSPDHIDTSKDGVLMGNGHYTTQGIEFDALGRRVAYWIWPHHPGERIMTLNLESTRVPASEVLHIYRVNHPGQVRGYPWGAPVLLRMRDFDSYADAQLMKQKTAASFAGFITEPDFVGQSQEALDLPEKIEPGMLEMLTGGRQITFSDPPKVDGYADYSSVTLHEIATGYGVPYSVLTGDLRQVNFSSGRMGDRSFNRNVKQWQQNVLINPLCRPVGEWFLGMLQILGEINGPVSQHWTPPRRELTDPAREIPALRDEVRSGFKTWAQACREMGYDPDDFIEEAQFWNQVMDQNGIVFDSDPRKVSGAGLSQARPGDAALPPTAPEGETDD